MADEFLWVSKYRPTKVKDCVLPEGTRNLLQGVVNSGNLQHMLFYSSTPGTGKTTSAITLAEEMGCDYLLINGSNEGRLLSTVRDQVEPFASTGSVLGNAKTKVVIWDEVDNSGSDVMKQLRGVIERVEQNCRFICTCNYPSKIIEPLASRLAQINFNVEPVEMPKMAAAFMAAASNILGENEITFSKKVLAAVITKHFPDFRKTLNALQLYSQMNGNVIDDGILVSSSSRMNEYIVGLKEKDFTKCRKWVAQNSPNSSFYGDLIKSLYTVLKGEALARAVLIVAEYQYKHSFSADSELNMAAMTIELITQCS